MNIFTKDRQIVSSPQMDDIEEAIVQFFNQIVASAEEIPRVDKLYLMFPKKRLKNHKISSLHHSKNTISAVFRMSQNVIYCFMH